MGLVEDEHGWPAGQDTSQTGAFPLAETEMMGQTLRLGFELDACETLRAQSVAIPRRSAPG